MLYELRRVSPQTPTDVVDVSIGIVNVVAYLAAWQALYAYRFGILAALVGIVREAEDAEVLGLAGRRTRRGPRDGARLRARFFAPPLRGFFVPTRQLPAAAVSKQAATSSRLGPRP